ncbi:MAG: antibiotic biosynthesis monooxygenase [Bacteroidota bacterium]|jgi:quinol monooxygenase YgiN
MQTPVFEVAVYKVQPEKLDQFLRIQSTAHDVIKKFEGFKSLHTLRSMESSDTFVDYCEWESHDAAQQANAKAAAMPELQVFFELGAGMLTFGHYTSLLMTANHHE